MTNGIEELLNNVRALHAKGTNAQQDALEDMSGYFQEVLHETIEYGMRHGEEIHIKDDVASSKPRRKDGVMQVKVGLAGSASRGSLPAWYAHFADTGSIKKAPTFFSERSRQKATPELENIIKSKFRQELGD